MVHNSRAHNYFCIIKQFSRGKYNVISRTPTFLRVIISYPFDGSPSDLLIVDDGAGGNLTKEEDHSCFCCTFCIIIVEEYCNNYYTPWKIIPISSFV